MITPEYFDVFASHQDAIAKGDLDRGDLADLIEDQMLIAIMLGADDDEHISMPICAARRVIAWMRETPKGKGSGRGKRARSSREVDRRNWVVEFVRRRSAELKAEGVAAHASLAAKEAEAKARELKIPDLSLGTIRDRMRRQN